MTRWPLCKSCAEGTLEGECNGWDGEPVFNFTNGSKCQQATYRYKYFYKHRPRATIWQDGGRQLIEIDGALEMARVRKIT